MIKSAILVIIIALTSCAKTVHHGYGAIDPLDEQITINTSNTSEVIAFLGPPTFINHPFNNELCYISAVGEQMMFFRFKSPKYKTTCYSFNQANIITNIRTIDYVKPQEVPYKKYNIKLEKPS